MLAPARVLNFRNKILQVHGMINHMVIKVVDLEMTEEDIMIKAPVEVEVEEEMIITIIIQDNMEIQELNNIQANSTKIKISLQIPSIQII